VAEENLCWSSLFRGLLTDLVRFGRAAGVAGVAGVAGLTETLLLSVTEMTGTGSSRFAMACASVSAMMAVGVQEAVGGVSLCVDGLNVVSSVPTCDGDHVERTRLPD